MRIAITGGTGFVGRFLARRLVERGHDVVLIARGADRRDLAVRELARATFHPIGLNDASKLAESFRGCDAVAHLAGINRQLGAQTYRAVHIEGTLNVAEAARRAGVRKIALLSFLRARPGCKSAYHESKWAAEDIVRSSGLDYTVVKAGVIYGRGDHMLDHLSRAFHTFPAFGLVGMRERPIAPMAVEDVVRVFEAALTEGKLSRQTVKAIGPEVMTLGDAVRRVAAAVGRRPLYVRLPVWFHRAFAWALERVMAIPMISRAQAIILAEGLVEAAPPCDELPEDLRPRRSFTLEQIRAGLPEPGGFTWDDCLCAARG